MANFDVVKLNNSPYDYLLIATSYRSSLSDDLTNLFNLEKSKVLFDFMLIHGNKKNRFVECVVLNDGCKKDTIKIPDEIDVNIREESSSYFKKNKNLIQNSVLPNSLKYLILNGDII